MNGKETKKVMEASSSKNSGGAKRFCPSSSSSMEAKGRGRAASMNSFGADLLLAIFSLLDYVQLIRCSAVCKSWNKIILESSETRDLYCSRNPKIRRRYPNTWLPSEASSIRSLLEEFAMEQHRLAFLRGSAQIYQWNAHSARINLCRMKRGLVLTGAEDKVVRLWSAENCSCLDEYAIPNMNTLIDYDFDENKIVGLASARMFILRRNGKKSTLQFREGSFTRGLCMGYIDPEVVVGCDDGRARVLDMYSGSCSRIIRMCGGPITCMALNEEQLIFGGSTFGTIAVADLSTGEVLASLKSSFSPTGMKCLDFNMRSHLLFAGSTSGYAHCWDLRTLRPLWEMRISPNVIYSVNHLSSDPSTLAVGGLDGVLRFLNQSTGELLSSFIMDTAPSINGSDMLQKRKSKALSHNSIIDRIPRSVRPPITSLAVGLNKIVTAHNEKYVSVWRFHK